MSTKNSTKIVRCPRCTEKGIMNLNHGTSYRVGHNYKDKNGKWQKKWHTIGTIKKDLKKLRNFSTKNHHIIDSNLIDSFDKLFNKNREIDTKIDLLALFLAIKEVGNKIDKAWNHLDEHYNLVRGLNCPHCKREIQIRYDRLGPPSRPIEINPKGRKPIEKRNESYTSRFRDGIVEKSKR